MRLVVKQNESIVNDYHFGKGPIYIGRHMNSQVFLPDRRISRHHAVIYCTEDGKWMVEDMDSANKTYLNGDIIHKAEIKTGDILRVADFTIDISFSEDTQEVKAIHLDDTRAAPSRGPQIIIRQLETKDAPPMRLPAKRASDFVHASDMICNAGTLDHMLQVLLDISVNQLGALHSWIAFRDSPEGPMIYEAGRHRNGQPLNLCDIKLGDKINEAVAKEQFMLFIFSRVQGVVEDVQVRSVLITPIIGQAGCLGVLYVDNAIGDEHYNLGDLDYLMLLAIHTAAVLKNL